MVDERNPGVSNDETHFSREVRAQAERKLKARRSPTGVWFGLGMMGLIGWSVAIPTLLGIALGIWLDERNSSGHYWTLSLLVAGLSLGCLNAWRWVANEQRAMNEENSDE